MMKKICAWLVAMVMMLCVLTACSSQPSEETGGWVADGKEHWKVFVESGEKTEVGAHELNDEFACSVCGSEVWDYGDGVSVYTYDSYGSITRMADYDTEGNLLSETVEEYEYDENGNIIKDTQYCDGVLSGETEYTVIDGESIVSKFTAFYDDASKSVAEYDTNGNVVKLTGYDSEGNVNFLSESEYAEDSEGEWYETQLTESYTDGSKIVCTYNEQSDILSRISYDADGNQESSESWEYTYDEDGHKQTEKVHFDGKIVQQITYKTLQSADESVTYPEVIAEYDENGELVSETKYDADGNVIG